ncbi:GDSL-like Lipase/Acylhydrolase superfamily protein [Wolffia australiana]
MAIPSFIFFAVSLLPLATRQAAACAMDSSQVPCFFIFGDSLIDNGNNNGILTLARANYPPYGVDFPGGSTGRFTNGRTVVDILAELLGFESFIPPYQTTRGSAVLRGLNYASGAAGIREESGSNLGTNIPMGEQVERFRRTTRQITRLLHGNRTAVSEHLGRCVFYSAIGSNDYLNNYFMPDYFSTSDEYDPKTYAALLLQDYRRQLAALYDLGARKVAVAGVGQIGCIPYQLARYDGSVNGSRCNEKINKAIAIFNSGLKAMVNRLNSEATNAKFTYINSFGAFQDLITNADSYGFDVVDKGCCGVGRNNGQITCLPFQKPCEDRTKFIFWDAFHPTDVANVILAVKAFNSTNRADVYPRNIQQLAAA